MACLEYHSIARNAVLIVPVMKIDEHVSLLIAIDITACPDPQAKPTNSWQFIFKVFAFYFDAGSYDVVNDALIKLVTCCQDYTHANL